MVENSVLVIGVGNSFRCDDSVGILAARQLKGIGNKRLIVLEQNGDGVSLMETWKNKDNVVLIDAVSSGKEPGTLHKFNALENPIPSKFYSCSSHNFGIAEAVEMSRALTQLPGQLRLYGIEGKNFQPGQGLSPEVEKTMARVVEEILLQVS